MLSIETRILNAREDEIKLPSLRVRNLKRFTAMVESLNDSLHYDDLDFAVDPELLKHAYMELWCLEALTEG